MITRLLRGNLQHFCLLKQSQFGIRTNGQPTFRANTKCGQKKRHPNVPPEQRYRWGMSHRGPGRNPWWSFEHVSQGPVVRWQDSAVRCHITWHLDIHLDPIGPVHTVICWRATNDNMRGQSRVSAEQPDHPKSSTCWERGAQASGEFMDNLDPTQCDAKRNPSTSTQTRFRRKGQNDDPNCQL